ncbi:hypothetical protein [Pedobacter agri]|uniref:hypothetical protein n=1 Tax=Pedobacter agri TaxID=454586 RepID=UPI00292CB469|nr:hypothetical protein [Pedobacter agri]
MFIVSLSFIGAFPEGNKVVTISSPNGGGGRNYHLMVDNGYWGIIGYYTTGWHVRLQNPNPDYSAGDLEPLLDYVRYQTIS